MRRPPPFALTIEYSNDALRYFSPFVSTINCKRSTQIFGLLPSYGAVTSDCQNSLQQCFPHPMIYHLIAMLARQFL